MASAPQFPDIPDPSPILDLGMGYWGSKALLTACDLRLFTRVHQGAATESDLASALGIPPRTTRILLNALAGLGLLQKLGPRYRLTPLASQFLVEDSPFYLGDLFIALDRVFYVPSVDLQSALKEDRPVWSADATGAHQPIGLEDSALVTRAMHGLGKTISRGFVRVCNLSKRSRILDIGGGSGIMSIASVQANPKLHATVLDRPAVCSLAAQYIADEGLSHRIDTQPVDFLQDPLPSGFDVHLFSNVLHNFSPEVSRSLLEKSFRALPPGGLVLVVEFDLRPDGISPLFAVLFNLFALTVMDGGETRPVERYREWLSDAGFTDLEHIPLFKPSSLVQAVKPG